MPGAAGAGACTDALPSQRRTVTASTVAPDTVLLQRIVSAHVLNAAASSALALEDDMPSLGQSVKLSDAGLQEPPPVYVRHGVNGTVQDALNDAIMVNTRVQWPACATVGVLALALAVSAALAWGLPAPASYAVGGALLLLGLLVLAWMECNPEAAFPRFLGALGADIVQNDGMVRTLQLAEREETHRQLARQRGQMVLLSGYTLPVRPATPGHLVVLPSLFAPGRPSTILADRAVGKRIEEENPWCLTHRGPCLCACSFCVHLGTWGCVCLCAACALGAT